MIPTRKKGERIVKLKGKQSIFLQALLESRTKEEAIQKAGIQRHTAYGYLKEPEFKQALREARREVVSLVSQRLSQSGETAINVLIDVVEDEDSPPSSKVQASRTILEYLYKSYEQDELEARIEELENHIQGEK